MVRLRRPKRYTLTDAQCAAVRQFVPGQWRNVHPINPSTITVLFGLGIIERRKDPNSMRKKQYRLTLVGEEVFIMLDDCTT